MEAYQFDDEQDGYSQIVYAESASKAKMLIDTDIQFINIRVHRAKWADQYGNMKDIPIEVLLNRGWWYDCNGGCGDRLYDQDLIDKTAIIEDNHIYCKECWDKLRR